MRKCVSQHSAGSRERLRSGFLGGDVAKVAAMGTVAMEASGVRSCLRDPCSALVVTFKWEASLPAVAEGVLRGVAQ